MSKAQSAAVFVIFSFYSFFVGTLNLLSEKSVATKSFAFHLTEAKPRYSGDQRQVWPDVSWPSLTLPPEVSGVKSFTREGKQVFSFGLLIGGRRTRLGDNHLQQTPSVWTALNLAAMWNVEIFKVRAQLMNDKLGARHFWPILARSSSVTSAKNEILKRPSIPTIQMLVSSYLVLAQL